MIDTSFIICYFVLVKAMIFDSCLVVTMQISYLHFTCFQVYKNLSLFVEMFSFYW